MKKAVVLTTARSGSNYLLGMLQSHPGIYFHGEIFNPSRVNGLRCNTAIEEKTGITSTALRDRDPLKFLDIVYDLAPRHMQVVGFKLFINHSEVALNHVVANPDYRIILLERENRLAVYSSAAIGRTTGVWRQGGANGMFHGDPAKAQKPDADLPSKVIFDPAEFERHRKWTDKVYREARAMLEGRDDVHQATYAQIQNPACVEEIIYAMHLRGPYVLKPHTERQNPGPLLDRFANPDDVVEYLNRHGLTGWLSE